MRPNRCLAVAFALLAVIGEASRSSAADSPLVKALGDFLQANFPGEGFLPAPSGGGQRFSPPTMWLRVKNAATEKTWSNGTDTAWLPFSDGTALYPERSVPMHHDPVNLLTLKADDAQKLALALSLAGGGAAAADLDAALSVSLNHELKANIETAEAEVVFGYYGDFLQAQEQNASQLDALKRALTSRFGSRLPDRRVVTAALRVRKAKISVSKTSGANVGVDASTQAALAKVGLKWDSTHDRAETLETGDEWTYLAFQALVADSATQRISTGAQSDHVETADFVVTSNLWAFPTNVTVP